MPARARRFPARGRSARSWDRVRPTNSGVDDPRTRAAEADEAIHSKNILRSILRRRVRRFQLGGPHLRAGLRPGNPKPRQIQHVAAAAAAAHRQPPGNPIQGEISQIRPRLISCYRRHRHRLRRSGKTFGVVLHRLDRRKHQLVDSRGNARLRDRFVSISPFLASNFVTVADLNRSFNLLVSRSMYHHRNNRFMTGALSSVA